MPSEAAASSSDRCALRAIGTDPPPEARALVQERPWLLLLALPRALSALSEKRSEAIRTPPTTGRAASHHAVEPEAPDPVVPTPESDVDPAVYDACDASSGVLCCATTPTSTARPSATSRFHLFSIARAERSPTPPRAAMEAQAQPRPAACHRSRASSASVHRAVSRPPPGTAASSPLELDDTTSTDSASLAMPEPRTSAPHSQKRAQRHTCVSVLTPRVAATRSARNIPSAKAKSAAHVSAAVVQFAPPLVKFALQLALQLRTATIRHGHPRGSVPSLCPGHPANAAAPRRIRRQRPPRVAPSRAAPHPRVRAYGQSGRRKGDAE